VFVNSDVGYILAHVMIIDHTHADGNDTSTPMKGAAGNNLCRSYPTGLCKAATEVLLSPMMLNASERLLVDPAVFC